MRKLGYIVGGIVVVVIIVLLAAPMFLDVNQYRGKIQSELQARLGRSVQLGDMHLRLLPLRVSADNVTIGEDARFHTGRPFAQAQSLAVSAQLLPLLHGQLDIHSLALDRPSIELVRDQNGVWNFSSLGAPAQQNQPKTTQPKDQKTGQNLSLGALDINDGTVAITDLQKHQTRAVYDHIDLAIRDFAPGKPFSITAAAHLPGKGKQVLQLDGTAGPVNDDVAKTPFDGSLKLQEVTLSGVNKFLNANALKDMDASVTGSAKVKNQEGMLASDGSLRFENARINGADLGFPVSLDYKASDDLNKDIVQIDKGAVKLGSTSLNLNGTVNTHPATAIADLHVVTKNANLAELARLTGATGSGTLDLDVHATGPMNDAMQYSGTGQLANASFQPASLTQPIKIKGVGLQFTRNGITLNNLAVSLGQTNASGQLTVRNLTAPNVDFNLSADKIDVAELQKMEKPAPPPKAGAKPQASPLANVTGKGTLSIGTLAYDQLVLTNLHSTVDLDHGILRFTPVTSQLYNGEQSGGVTVDTRSTPPTVQMALGLQNVDANKLLSSVSSVKETLYGLLAAKSQASFAVGSSAQDIAKSLNGTLSLNLTNGKLAHVDLLNQLANIAKFARGGQAQNFTNLAKLTGNFNVSNGVAATNDLVAQIDGGSLAAQGTANLVNNGLNMHMTAVLGKALSQTVGGTGIGGFMNTALANKNGELVIPVLVTGTFDHPQFAPDLQKLAQMKLQNLLPTSGNPAAGVLGGILGGQGGQQGAQGALGGILGALGGRNRQQQNQQSPQLPQSSQPPDQQQQKQQPNAGDLLQQLLGGKKKQQQQQQQQAPPPRQ